VAVEGFQWGWLFTYDDGVTIQSLPDEPAELVLPVGEPIAFTLESPDVIHSFYVPRLLMKRDVIPGRTNRIDVVFNEAGTYDGKCAEFCGFLHDQMDFSISAVPPEEFEDWMTQQAQGSEG
jgi:cytochrome c oxidase subunit 2